MIHCYAAWFCQGGLARTLLQALWLAGPWVTRSCWESWDVRHDSEESCMCTTLMLWGYRSSVWISVVGETFVPFYRWAKKWVKRLAVIVGGKCVSVIVANAHVQFYSHLSASRWINTDLHSSYTSPSTSQTSWKTRSRQQPLRSLSCI